jgi:transposase
VLSFCARYGTALLPTKPYTPRHKGKVERGIDYVQEDALKGRVFASLKERQRHLPWLPLAVAKPRTGKVAHMLYERMTKASLRTAQTEHDVKRAIGETAAARDAIVGPDKLDRPERGEPD